MFGKGEAPTTKKGMKLCLDPSYLQTKATGRRAAILMASREQVKTTVVEMKIKKINKNPLLLGEGQETLSCKEPAKVTGGLWLPQGGTGSLRKPNYPKTQDTGPP